jgi:hypothetical protein
MLTACGTGSAAPLYACAEIEQSSAGHVRDPAVASLVCAPEGRLSARPTPVGAQRRGR